MGSRSQRPGSGCLGPWLAVMLCCAFCSFLASAEQHPSGMQAGLKPPAAATTVQAAAVTGYKPANSTGWKGSSTAKPAAFGSSGSAQKPPAESKLVGSSAVQVTNKTGSTGAWKAGGKALQTSAGKSSSNSSSSSTQSSSAAKAAAPAPALKSSLAPPAKGNITSSGKQWQGSSKNNTSGKSGSSTASRSWSSSSSEPGSKSNTTATWKFSGKAGAVKANSSAPAVPPSNDKAAAGNNTSGKLAATGSPAGAAVDAPAAAALQQVDATAAAPTSAIGNSSSDTSILSATPPVAATSAALTYNNSSSSTTADSTSAVAIADVAAVPSSVDSVVDVISAIADVVTTIADMVNSNATAPPTAAANFTAAGSSSSGITTVIGNSTAVFSENVTFDIESAAVCRPPAYQPPPRGTPPPPLEIRRGTLVNRMTGRPVTIRGINWFGFNVDMGMVDGLWAGGSDATTDFSKIAYQIRMLGFNAVRLPFAHKFLAKTDVWDLVRDCSTVSGTKLKDRLIAPEDANQIALRRTLPPHPAPMRNTPGKCNTYLPMRNNLDRLLFAVQQFVALGMYVVLDYQPQGLEQHAYNLVDFVTAWGNLWRRVTCLPNFSSDLANRVLIDVMNEPDSMGIRWEASGDRPGAEQLYLATADALWNISPDKLLFMFEGTGQNMFGLNWGNGFITDQDIINSRGLSNPNKFFQRLVKKPYAKKSIISPHLYPPTITKSTWLGDELWKQSNTSFGYLQSTGYCQPNGYCVKFPVLVGETGSAYTEQDDKTWLKDFADFANARGSARRYNQIPLAGWMWWAYNENSGDTGGIVHNDWQDLHWAKLRYMMDYLGLTPWYKTSDAGRSPRTPSPVAPNPPPRQPPSGSGRQPPVRRPGAGSGAGRRPRNPRDATDRPRMPREGRTRGRLQRRRQHRRPSPRARMAAAGFAASTQL